MRSFRQLNDTAVLYCFVELEMIVKVKYYQTVKRVISNATAFFLISVQSRLLRVKHVGRNFASKLESCDENVCEDSR